jgi:hypothetical protein
MIEQTQVGAIAILRTSLGPVGPVVPEVNVFNMPFVFRDEAHMRKVVDGPRSATNCSPRSPPARRRWWPSAGWTAAPAASI